MLGQTGRHFHLSRLDPAMTFFNRFGAPQVRRRRPLRGGEKQPEGEGNA
jgi:hypothetical protein